MRSEFPLYYFCCDSFGCDSRDFFRSIKHARFHGWLVKNDSYKVYCPKCRVFYDGRGRKNKN